MNRLSGYMTREESVKEEDYPALAGGLSADTHGCLRRATEAAGLAAMSVKQGREWRATFRFANSEARRAAEQRARAHLHETEVGGAGVVHGQAGDGDVRVHGAVGADELGVVHAVEVVAGQDDDLRAIGGEGQFQTRRQRADANVFGRVSKETLAADVFGTMVGGAGDVQGGG